MKTKFTTIMLMGICGLGLALATTNCSASDLSRFLERSRINVAYGAGYPGYYGGYAAPYGPQYYPQTQWNGYGPAVPMGYGYGSTYGYGSGYGYGTAVVSPGYAGYGTGPIGYGGGYCHHRHW